jgi:hypothetical protein
VVLPVRIELTTSSFTLAGVVGAEHGEEFGEPVAYLVGDTHTYPPLCRHAVTHQCFHVLRARLGRVPINPILYSRPAECPLHSESD